MVTITRRTSLNRNLTALEVDTNFDNLNTAVGQLESRGISFNVGMDGSDVTSLFLAACAESNAKKIPLLLPPWTITISQTAIIDKMIGVPGKSKIILAPTFVKTGFGNQFCLLSSTFSQTYSESTAAEIYFSGFDIETSPNAARSILGLANIKRGLIEGVNVKVNRVISTDTGKPVAVDTIFDLYAAVKNLEVRKCDLRNVTGAYGATKISEFGGSCMWIRNLSSNGANPLNVTENIDIHHNYFEHMTSDEILAVFGVRGVTRRVQIHHNRFIGLPSIDGVYHNTFLSIFPLDDGSGVGLGNTAATYENDIFDNYIRDEACLYDLVRIGNSADSDQPCYNNRSARNRVVSIRSTNVLTGPQAVWVSLGSIGPNPEIASSLFRCVDGTFGAAYFRDTSGNTSTDDIAENSGGTCGAGFLSWQQVQNPTVLGDIFTGASSCRLVTGGKVEASGRGFFNCRSVVGTNYRINGVGGIVFEVDTSLGGIYGMNSTVGEVFGRFVRLGGAAPSGTKVGIFNNVCQMTSAGAYYILQNETSSGAVISARNNISLGINAGITNGVGTINRSGNDWNGVTD